MIFQVRPASDPKICSVTSVECCTPGAEGEWSVIAAHRKQDAQEAVTRKSLGDSPGVGSMMDHGLQ